MSDPIDRQTAIDAIGSIIAVARTIDDGLILIDKADAQAELMKLPSAQQERKKGEWIEREVTHIDDLEAKDIITSWQSCKCSVCGRYDTKPYMYYFNAPKYCGWCGADMREVSE